MSPTQTVHCVAQFDNIALYRYGSILFQPQTNNRQHRKLLHPLPPQARRCGMRFKLLETFKHKAPRKEQDSPLLRLPRELRDKIYSLVAATETRLHLYISLKKEEKPKKAIFTTGGLGRTGTQLKREYTEALGEFVSKLVRSREQDFQLGSAEYLVQCNSASLQVSRTWHTNGTYVQNTHTLRIPVPYEVHRGSGWVRKRDHSTYVDDGTKPLFTISFADHESKELAFRHSLSGSLYHKRKSADVEYWWPKGAKSAIGQIATAVKGADWKGSLPLLSLWYVYGSRIAREMREDEEAVRVLPRVYADSTSFRARISGFVKALRR